MSDPVEMPTAADNRVQLLRRLDKLEKKEERNDQ